MTMWVWFTVEWDRTLGDHVTTFKCSHVNHMIFCLFRLLVRKARKIAVQYERDFHETIPVSQLVQKLATVMQEYTQSG